MAWTSSLSVVRQTVGCFLGGACAGGTRAEQIWAGCRCPFHLGAVVLFFFTAWKVLVCEFLLLFLSPGILTGARGCLQPVLSTHISHSGKRKAGLGVLCHSYPQLQGVPVVLMEMPRDVHPPSNVPKMGSERGPVGMGTAWGDLSTAVSCCAVGGGIGGFSV